MHGEEKHIMLSLDGVSESKSTTTSLDVYTLKFRGCRDIYPIKIIREINKYKIDGMEQLSKVLEAVLDQDLEIDCLVADNPKRSFLRNSLQAGGKLCCEYCFQAGVSFCPHTYQELNKFSEKFATQKRDITLQIENLDDNADAEQIQTLKSVLQNFDEVEKIGKKKKHSHIVWPASTMNGEMRTKDKILDIVEKLEAGHDLSQLERKGIKGRSLLLNIENFDYVICIPTEYMHAVCLCLMKRLLELTFAVGEKRQRITKRPLTLPIIFNEAMKTIKVFKEFSRRARKLDLSVMKAQELRNTLLFFFPIITKTLHGNDKEIKLWEMFAFMIRACILPENEYANVNTNQIQYCQKNFYILYEQLFGIQNCTYSVHVVSSHLINMRSLGPLTETSAFAFEAFYSELRHAFQPGTVSVVKQMLQNVLLKRMLSNHVCSETIYLSEKDTALECNSLIYIYEDSKHIVYKIKSIVNDILTCNQMGNHELDLPNTHMLNWSSVGVYRKGGLSSLDVTVNRKNVCGKVMKVDNYLITCPNNILREK